MEIVLSIAGSDPSAGAGVQQDLKTMTAMGCYGATVITALTSQNTLGVQDVVPVSGTVVASQLQSVFSDLDIKAVKIGQIPNREVAIAIVSELQTYLDTHPVPVVYDPVMLSTSGRHLMQDNCIGYLSDNLFPLCTLVTPNIPEAEVLAETSLSSQADLDRAGMKLVEHFGCAFLLKGGHAEGTVMTDSLYDVEGSIHRYTTEKIPSRNLHGTGCTLSSAIASALAKGAVLADAVATAKDVVTKAIQQGSSLQIGNGNGPLWVTLA